MSRYRIAELMARGAFPLSQARNGRMAQASMLTALGRQLTTLSGRRRRLLYSHSLVPAEISVAGPWPHTDFPAQFRTGLTGGRVRVRHVVTTATSTLTTYNPRFFWRTQKFNGLATNRPTIYTPSRLFSTSPSLHSVIDQVWDDMEPDTLYEVDIQRYDTARILSVTIWEEPLTRLDADESRPKRGAGDSFAVSGSNIVLTDAGATFLAEDVGRKITIVGATSDDNNGSFTITARTATTVTYENPSGVTEAFSGTWNIGEDGVNFSRLTAEGEIVNGDVWHILDRAHQLWKRQGSLWGHWNGVSAHTPSGLGTWRNIWTDSAAAAGASTPGFWVYPEKCGAFEDSQVPIVCWVQGSDGGAATANVRFYSTTGGATLATIPLGLITSAYVATTIPSGTSPEKIDVQMESTNGLPAVSACGVYQWEP